MEEWKLIKEYNSFSTLHLKGDKIYVSNKGRIKLNDDILEIGKGLYINKNEICIYGCGYGKYKTLYRLIYSLFKGELKFGSNYNIHHIDYNHLNNDIDNLLLCTSYEHGLIHADDRKTGKIDILRKYNNNIYDLEDKKDEQIKSSREYLINRVKTYIQQTNLNKEKEKQNKIELTKKRIQKEREDKLASGEYGINKYGHLYRLDVIDKLKKSRIGLKSSEYTKQKIRAAAKELWKDADYRSRVVNSLIQYNTERKTKEKYQD